MSSISAAYPAIMQTLIELPVSVRGMTSDKLQITGHYGEAVSLSVLIHEDQLGSKVRFHYIPEGISHGLSKCH